MNEGSGPGSPSQIRVLIADDDRAFLASLQQLIERQPELSVVGAARDGLEAIELAEDLSPDAVVLDLHMPLLDGVTAAARLRRDHPNVCLIALTGDEAPAPTPRPRPDNRPDAARLSASHVPSTSAGAASNNAAATDLAGAAHCSSKRKRG